jgi:aspartate carbamoyltransferase regulatory subunit
MKTKIVSAIENGTVIDHLEAGTAPKVATILDLFNMTDTVIMGMHLDSQKMGRKDIIKIKNKILTKDQIDRIALICPKATINIVENHDVKQKFEVEIPQNFENIIKCRNPACISRSEEVVSKFSVFSRNPLKVKCNYCEKVYKHFDLL